jgi:hypothetical protein
MYDPVGADAGGEFVELYNSGTEPLSLSGVQIAFANGANGPDWQERWVGGAADSIGAGGFFLIVDNGWTGNADAFVNLDLQNGPDGIMLTRDGQYLDLLGYGPLQHEGLCEFIPHPGSGSGKSLGRKPDGNDSDVNLHDWFILDEPNPGVENFSQLSISILEYNHSPPLLLTGHGTVISHFTLLNDGLLSISPTVVQVLVSGLVAGSTYLPEIAPGVEAEIYLTWNLSEEGTSDIELSFPDAQLFTQDIGAYRCGLTGLVLSEVMVAPGSDSCEWIEIENGSENVIELTGYQIQDADNESTVIPAVSIDASQIILIVQNLEKFTEWWLNKQSLGAWPDCSMPVILELDGSWPALNNSPPADRNYSDHVLLRNPEGVVVDWLQVGGNWDVPEARSVERVNVIPVGDPGWNWRPSTATAKSTPGCINSVSGATVAESTVIAEPNPVSSGVQHLSFFVNQPATRWQARIYNLSGRCVRELGGDQLGEGPRNLFWEGRDNNQRLLEDGGYIFLVQYFNENSELLDSEKLLLSINYGEK